MRRLKKWLYQAGLLRSYDRVDMPRYLKRLRRPDKPADDQWYFSAKDLDQDGGGEVLVLGRFRQTTFRLYCHPDIPLEMKTLRGRGLYDPHTLELMADLTPPGSLLLDIGANSGAIAIPAALARPDLTLHAFEPNPHALLRFRRNLRLNAQAANLRLWDVAVGDNCGQGQFHAYDGVNLADGSFIACPRARQEREPISVSLVTLDSIFAEDPTRVGFIKIDVQGFESRVLAGARRMILRDRPFIVFEHEDGNFEREAEAVQAKQAMADFFAEAKYEVFYQTRYGPELLFPVAWNRPLNGNLIAIP